MILKFLMAAVRKGPSGALDRVTSAGTRNKPRGAPLRSIHPNSSPVYKTQSETALTSGLSKLSINDNKAKPGLKRNFSSGKNLTNGGVKNIADVASLLQNESVKNIVVVAGAGISTPSGIPDFRSPGTGLYDNLQQYNIPYPEAIFDIDYFFVNPRPFFTLAKELYPSGKYRPNYIHYFVRQLYDKGLLLRMYTQNIDGLERLAGIPGEKMVEAHGTFATATCTICQQKFEGSDIKEKIFSDKLPRCPTRGCVGIVKPDIVFFGEDLPRKFYSYMKDMLQADLVLVMGTSLEVQPFAGIIDTVHSNVPRVLFNREAVGPFRYSRRTQDLVFKGDLVDNMVKFATMVGWKEDMVQLITKEEGQFTIEPRKPPKGPSNSKPSQGKQLNKPPPAARNRNRDNNRLLYRGRAKFTLYDEDSSSESSDSDSTSSSESSDDGRRKNRFHGTNGRKTVNSTVKNGFGAKGNSQVRATSAKINNTTKREFHTQRNTINGKFSPAGNLSGRSIKSESAINSESTRRKVQNGNKFTPKETLTKKKEAFVSPSKNEVISSEEKKGKETTLNLKEPILVRNEMPLKHEDIVSARAKVEKPLQENNNMVLTPQDATFNGPKEAFLSAAQSHSTEQNLSHVENVNGTHLDTAENSTVVEETNSGHLQVDKDTDNKLNNAVTERQKVSTIEREKILKKYGIGENPIVNNIIKVSKQTEKLVRPMKSVKSDSAIACGYFIEDLKQKSDIVSNEKIDKQPEIADTVSINNEMLGVDNGNNVTNIPEFHLDRLEGKIDMIEVSGRNENGNTLVKADNSATEQDKKSVKLQEYNMWKEEISSRDKFMNLFDKNDGSVIDGYASSTSSKTLNRNDKGSKVLNEKTARSFAKYANFTSDKKASKKHGKKPRRISLKDRPSPGPKIPTSKTELQVVNSRPYGYAHRQANRVKGVGPFHRTNVRTLNSAIDQTSSELMLRSGSAEIPKITYRHKLEQQMPVRDPRMFGMMAVTPALASDSSDDMIS